MACEAIGCKHGLGRERPGSGTYFDFASAPPPDKLAQASMMKLDVCVAGVRDPNKIVELDDELRPLPGHRYNLDRNEEIACLELDDPTSISRDIGSISINLELEPRFGGGIPAELRRCCQTETVSA